MNPYKLVGLRKICSEYNKFIDTANWLTIWDYNGVFTFSPFGQKSKYRLTKRGKRGIKLIDSVNYQHIYKI